MTRPGSAKLSVGAKSLRPVSCEAVREPTVYYLRVNILYATCALHFHAHLSMAADAPEKFRDRRWEFGFCQLFFSRTISLVRTSTSLLYATRPMLICAT